MNTQEKIDFERMKRDVNELRNNFAHLLIRDQEKAIVIDELQQGMFLIAEKIGELNTQVEDSELAIDGLISIGKRRL